MNTQNHTEPPLLTREEVEQLLPDYAFGELSDYDAQRVAASLSAFPDLQEEYVLIQESFAEVNTAFEAEERANAQRLRNLTVHVQDRLREDAEKKARRWKMFRFVVPVFTAVAAVVIIVSPKNLSISDSVKNRLGLGGSHDTALVLQPDEVKALEENQELAASGLLDADATVNDKALSDALESQLNAQESKMAAQLLRKETMKTLARNTSAFHDYFDNSAEMQHITDEDVERVAAALTEM